ncbi:MAG TPA: protein-disulfide reductase DsbD domain-containing protein [Kiloniellales bacterium]
MVGLLGHVPGIRAEAGPWLDQEQARLRLIAGGQAAAVGQGISLGLQFALQPGWKIYWRAPGDAGYPPTVDWSGSDNLAGAEMRWPVPHRFSLFGLETFGYSDEVVLPVEARAVRPGEAVLLRAKVDYLICADICIPREALLGLDLPAGAPASSPEAMLIDKYRALVPGDGTAVGLRLQEAVLTGDAQAPVLRVTARSQTPFRTPDVLVEAPPGYSFGKPQTDLRDGGTVAVLHVPIVGTPAQGVLEGKRLTLTITDGRRGMEQPIITRFADPAAAGGWAALAGIIGLAFLGGLILNLMPCVLPVLSLKLLAVAKQGGRASGQIRAGFLASAAGIVVSFLVLAAGAIVLKSLGLRVGWGIQFQQPLFLAGMALVVTLFAYNLFGFFEIALPGWAATLGNTGMGRAGAGNTGRHLGGHFLTGAFATVLATPCSAPFLGTALGFALARGAGEILLIFAALGLGLALPYLLIAASPRLVAWLPRPGPWMVTLRRVLGLALAGTAAWLLSVLMAQVGLSVTLGVGALLLGLGLVLWHGHARGEHRFATPALAGVLAVAAVAMPAALAERIEPSAVTSVRPATAAASVWQPFAPDQISGLVAQGKTVFVDITADWCITCRVNKALVLDSEQVHERLSGENVIAMRGDWTLPSDEISLYLERFGRYGIPFDAVYGPGAPAGVALPELLSIDGVLQTLDRAGGG